VGRATTNLAKGAARVSIEITKAARRGRQVDCFLLTNDLSFVPKAAANRIRSMRYLRDWSAKREAFFAAHHSSTTAMLQQNGRG